MKLSIFDRILMFLSMVLMLAIGVGLIMLCTSSVSLVTYAQLFEAEFSKPLRMIFLIASAAVLIIVSVKLILALFISPRERTSTDSIEKIVLKNGESGNIMVSSELVKDIAVRCAKTADEVKDVDCRIICQEEGVKIMMKYAFKRDIDINEFLTTAQNQIKEYVELHAGINVSQVDLCADINPGTGSRLR